MGIIFGDDGVCGGSFFQLPTLIFIFRRPGDAMVRDGIWWQDGFGGRMATLCGGYPSPEFRWDGI